jgi:glucose-6-phosphate dehydrogenase assembly protein OpcA
MVGDRPRFDDLMVDARRAMLALDNVTVGGASRAKAAAVSGWLASLLTPH